MAAETVAKLSTFAWTVVAARKLTQSNFGALNFALSVALILAAIAEWGFDPLLVQRTAKEPAQASRLFTQAITWEGGVASIAFGITMAIAGATATSGTTRLLILLVLAATYLDVYADTIRAAGVALQRQGSTSMALIVQRFATVLLVVPVLLAGGGVTGFAIAFVASYLIGAVAHLVALRHLQVRPRLALIDREGMRSFWNGSLRIGLSALLLAVLFRVDALMLSAIKGNAALGAYAAAYKVFETSLFVAFAIGGALFAVMSERGEDSRRVREVLETAIGAVLVFFLPYAVVCLVEARELLTLLFGARYGHASADALRWLAFAPAIYAIGFVTQAALVARERTNGMLVAAAATTVLNIALNAVLIPELSIEGAAIVTTVSCIVQAGILLVFMTRVSEARPRLVRAIVPSALSSGVVAVLLVAVSWHVLVEIAVAIPLYLIVWWTLARRIDPGQVERVLHSVRPVAGAEAMPPATGPAQSSKP